MADKEQKGAGAAGEDDDGLGAEPKARDGEPMSLAEHRNRRGRSVDSNGGGEEELRRGDGEEDDGQLFVWEQGRKVTLGTLVARGIPVEHAFIFGGKRLKGSGGLVSFEDDVLLVSRGKVGKTSLVPTRDDDEKVTKVVIETHIAAKVVVPADSEEAMGMLAGVLDKRQAS